MKKLLLLSSLILLGGFISAQILKKPIPDKLVVLTFDDAVSTHYSVVAPLLKKYGFGATFYVCEFPPDFEDKGKYMSWEQIQELHDMGFEIGNHTGHHKHVNQLSELALTHELAYIEKRCRQYGIPHPQTFAYPAYNTDAQAVEVLEAQGYEFARTGGAKPYNPLKDHPFLIPSYSTTGDRKEYVLDALNQAQDGQIVVLTIHGVPDYAHDWVSTPPELFQSYLTYLSDNDYTVIALRDLNTYIDAKQAGKLLKEVHSPAGTVLRMTEPPKPNISSSRDLVRQNRFSTSKPWTRWWWHGSSVTKEGITQELEALQEVGIGGVELTPIYGVIGEEEEFIPFLSPQWVEMLEYTVGEAHRLGLGIDMATGTGWPFGGPWVGEPESAKYISHKKWNLKEGESLEEKVEYIQEPILRDVFNRYSRLYDQKREQGESITQIPPDFDWSQINQRPTVDQLIDPISQNPNLQQLALDQVRFPKPIPLISLMAYSDKGEVLNLTSYVEGGKLNWVAPNGNWTLYALFQGGHGKMVERAAPGGEGLVIDHFSQKAIEHYLDRFDKAMEEASLDGLRAYFNDSYEVDDANGEANWTMDFLKAFEEKRGYDLQQYVPALWGDDTEENNQRVLSDYRETLSELLLETFTLHWGKWAKDQGKIIRNQAHGSPANILDLYAASDIPETEGTDIIRAKFASSAANVSGKPLVSAEAATWLGEHFTTNLADLKENVDRYFMSGVNHIFYHGTCYSPPGETWPGRLFYAAFHANSRNPQWRHFDVFNEYIARTQAILQASIPDNEVLLYFPMYDQYASPSSGLLTHFDGHGPVLEATEVYANATFLLEEGYSFDFISDKQVSELVTKNSEIQTGLTSFKTLWVPKVHYMPIATLEKLIHLAKEGATVIFHKGLPESFPGMGEKEERQRKFGDLVESLSFMEADGGIKETKVGQGKIIVGEEMKGLIDRVGVKREQLVDSGLAYVRKRMEDTTLYLLTNWSGKAIDQYITLNVSSESLLIADPMTGVQGQVKTQNHTGKSCQVRIQLSSGGSLFIRTHPKEGAINWNYYEQGEKNVQVRGKWVIDFIDGGPELPPSFELDDPSNWTHQEDSAYLHFSGTAVYRVNFPKPSEAADAWLLDLGSVHESAHVKLNGQSLGTLIGPTFQIQIPAEAFEESNLLEIEVSNLMANRITDLDRRGVFWKRFYNINVSARTRENLGPAGVFDASQWEVRPSGLGGPVYLIPQFLIKAD